MFEETEATAKRPGAAHVASPAQRYFVDGPRHCTRTTAGHRHWSLLASRSTTQSEVLTRISIFLTLTSAGLVSLALAGQAMKFDENFAVLAIVVLVLVIVIGHLTQVRVLNVGIEDLAYVLAMNRLRAAYVELDPGIAPYLMASRFDDQAGSMQTYYMLPRSAAGAHVAGSSMILIIVVNSILVGVLLAGGCVGLGVSRGSAMALAIGGGVLYFVGFMWVTRRGYLNVWKNYFPKFPANNG